MDTVSSARSSGKREGALDLLLRAALWCAAQGWAVLPLHYPTTKGCSCGSEDCRSIGKHPLLLNGVKGASKIEAVITRWWGHYPNANVGVATGSVSGIVVLDVDGEVGMQSLRRLCGKSLSATLTSLTGRKSDQGQRAGRHMFFAIPAGSIIRNSVGRLGPGLDVRGENGFVVAPPSRHASGLRYQWDLATDSIAEAPSWMFPMDCATHPISKAPATSHDIPEGCRNDKLYRVGAALRRRGRSQQDILRLVHSKNRRDCKPPLDDLEVRRIVANIMRYERVRRHPLHTAFAKVVAEKLPNRYEQFLSLARHLQRSQPTRPILLPVVQVSRLLNCHWTLISKFRKRAIAEGEITVKANYVWHQRATLFTVRLTGAKGSH